MITDTKYYACFLLDAPSFNPVAPRKLASGNYVRRTLIVPIAWCDTVLWFCKISPLLETGQVHKGYPLAVPTTTCKYMIISTKSTF